MSSNTSSDLLVQLTSQRWLIALLVDLAARDGARFAELLHRLRLPRDSCARTLVTAQQAGWVVRNAGHGHPLRPEYVLTPSGRDAARLAARIDDAEARLGVVARTLPRWGLPIVGGIARGHDRFNALGRWLAPATPRALSQGLVALDRQALVSRAIVTGRPPSSRYRLTDTGRMLADACLG